MGGCGYRGCVKVARWLAPAPWVHLAPPSNRESPGVGRAHAPRIGPVGVRAWVGGCVRGCRRALRGRHKATASGAAGAGGAPNKPGPPPGGNAGARGAAKALPDMSKHASIGRRLAGRAWVGACLVGDGGMEAGADLLARKLVGWGWRRFQSREKGEG